MNQNSPISAHDSSDEDIAAELTALRKEVGWLRGFTELSADWFWEQDAELRFTGFTGHSTEKLAHNPDQFVGKRRWDMPISGITLEQMQAHMACCARHEAFRDFEYDTPSADGTLQRFSISGTPVFDDANVFIGYRGVGRNITTLYNTRRALIERDVTLAQIVDGNPVACFVIDANHRVTHWNRACESLTGIRAAEVIGTDNAWRGFYDTQRPTLSDLVLSGADDEQFALIYGESVRPSNTIQGAIEAEAYFPNLSGAGTDSQGLWLYFTAAPLLDLVGRRIGALETLQDVSDKRRNEAAMTALVRDYGLIFDNTLIGISYQRNRVIERCNRRLEEMFGWAPGELIGRSSRVFFDSDEAWYAAGSRVYPGAETFDGEMDYVRKDGTPITVHIVGRATKVGADSVWVWTYDDVTEKNRERIRHEKLLSDYTLIFESSLVGMAFMKNRIFLRCNRQMEEMFGYPAGSLVGQTSRRLFFDEQDWVAIGIEYREAADRGQRIEKEVRFQRSDGEPLWARVSGRRVTEAEGDAWVWNFQDVTRRRIAEEELRRSNVELEQRVEDRTRELSQQLNFMQELIEAIPGPVFYKNRAGEYLGCNQAFSDFLGIHRDEVIGRTAYDLSPKALADKYFEADEALYRSSRHQVYETKVQAATGERRDVMFQKAVYHDANAQIAGLIGVMLDITDRIAMEAQLRQSATVFDSTADGVLIADGNGAIVAVNRAFSEITGYAEDEVIGSNPRLLQSGRQSPEFYQAMWAAIGSEGRWRGELWNRRKDGTEFVEWLTISAVKDKAGAVSHYVAVFSDVTPMKKAQERLDYQAHHDALTGLPNRLLFEDRIQKVVSHARRDGASFALLFIDLDRFKIINDTLGHHVGDVVLIEVSKRFESLVRESDTVARLGGDEFIVVIENIAGPSDASRVADKILESLRECIVGADQEFFIGASIGISLFPADGEDAASLLKAADSAMYRAKDRGRNTYEFVTADLTEISLERFRLEVDIRHAVERVELRPFFQAQYSLQTGELVGAEALIRWLHPKQGLVPPGKFIPLAEESGLIVEVGAWILREACGVWAQWVASGLNPGLLSVNVSGVEFRRGHVYLSVCSALEESGLEARYLSLEITESAIMNQAEGSIKELRALRDLGVQLAIDDFGTGYSSLSYLKRLPLNKLKIDQSFVRGLPADEEDAAITRAVIALAHSLQFSTIAEGVETDAQREFLKALGCDEMQGFLKARPVPAAEFEATILRSLE